MRKKKLLWLFGITSLIFASIVLVLAVLVKHEPGYYRTGHVPASADRKASADKLLKDFAQMLLNKSAKQATWMFEASEAQFNSFFAEAFTRQGEAENLSKLGISSPCVTFEGEQMRLAFRYGKGFFSTVVSYDVKFWLVPKEPNVVAVQILSARAGALPISPQTLLNPLSEFARRQSYDVTPYRYETTPVVVVRLQDPNAASVLKMLKIDNNTLKLRGVTLDHAVAAPVLLP